MPCQHAQTDWFNNFVANARELGHTHISYKILINLSSLNLAPLKCFFFKTHSKLYYVFTYSNTANNKLSLTFINKAIAFTGH